MNESKAKILIAEDELLIAMDIKQKLEEESYEVTSLVSTALEAITKVETDKPDLILMDIQLSGSLTGIEAADIISYKTNLPIIFLTTPLNEHLITETKTRLEHLHLLKPIQKKHLYSTIEKVLTIFRTKPEIANSKSTRPPSYTF
jgi:CheY-like chemotaxis protein